MYNFPIGIIIDGFRIPAKEAILKASGLGANGIQMFSTTGENSPENLDKAKRKELLDVAKSNGLVFSAICGDLGKGFGNADINPELIEKSKRIMDLANDLETKIVTTHIGVVPADPEHERYKIMQDACSKLAQYADSCDSHFALETGPETSDILKGFLDSLNSRGLGVNFDPANLVMVAGDDPVKAVHNLKDYIVHTHAKDGVMLKRVNPEIIYGILHPVPQELQGVKFYQELPLGKGDVDFPNYLKALEEVGYRGFLTIEREHGDDPAGDIAMAVDFLKGIIDAN